MEGLKFLKPVPPYLVCAVCCEIFTKPVRIPCGHTYCAGCIESWGKREKTCPICRKKIGNGLISPDIIATYVVNDIEVECIVDACEWNGRYEDFFNHFRGIHDGKISDYKKIAKTLLIKYQDFNELIVSQIEKGADENLIQELFRLHEVEVEKKKDVGNEVQTSNKKLKTK